MLRNYLSAITQRGCYCGVGNLIKSVQFVSKIRSSSCRLLFDIYRELVGFPSNLICESFCSKITEAPKSTMKLRNIKWFRKQNKFRLVDELLIKSRRRLFASRRSIFVSLSIRAWWPCWQRRLKFSFPKKKDFALSFNRTFQRFHETQVYFETGAEHFHMPQHTDIDFGCCEASSVSFTNTSATSIFT